MEERATTDIVLDEAHEALRDGARTLEAMEGALDVARRELDRAHERLAQTAGPAGDLRSVLADLIDELRGPALLVDADLWITSANEGAASRLGGEVAEVVGSSLARWPGALERSRLVRRAAQAPPGMVEGDGRDRAFSFGLTAEDLPPVRRSVLLLLG